MTTAADGAPTALRVARVITIVHTVAASIAVVIGLLFAVTARHHDDVARRAGHPNQFEGLGFGVGMFVVVVFGTLALAAGAAAIGLCRSRAWGLLVAGLTEGVVLLVAVLPAASGRSPVWLPVIVPCAAVVAAVVSPKSRAFCRTRALA